MLRNFFPTVICSLFLLGAPAFAAGSNPSQLPSPTKNGVTEISTASQPQFTPMQRELNASLGQYNTLQTHVTELQSKLAQLQKSQLQKSQSNQSQSNQSQSNQSQKSSSTAKPTDHATEIARVKAAIASDTVRLNQLSTIVSRESAILEQEQVEKYNAHQDKIATYTERKHQAILQQENDAEAYSSRWKQNFIATHRPPAPAAAAGAPSGPIYYDPWNTVVFPDLQ